MVLIVATVFGLIWNRPELTWVAVAALVAGGDALLRSRRPAGSPVLPIAVDTVAVGAVMLVSGLPLPVMGAPLAYLLTASLLLLSPRAAMVAVAHTSIWLVAAFVGSSWSIISWTAQQELILGGLATAIFFTEMTLLISAAARALRERQEALTALMQAKDEFVASVSHELRTPLTAVLGFAEELRDRRDDMPSADVAQLLDLVVSQSRDLADIVDDLLVTARLQVGTVSVSATPIHLREAVTSLLDTLPDVGGRVTVQGEGTAFADSLRLRQILRNLLSNAQRYGGEDVAIAIRSDDGMVRVEVSDDGPGIPDDSLGRLFEPYERLHHDEGKPDSVGLGLYVARSLAQIMGGDLSYQRLRKRSVFILTLPAAQIPQLASTARPFGRR
jgi:signal transduction histidine kinase